jgi:hypothetical protein
VRSRRRQAERGKRRYGDVTEQRSLLVTQQGTTLMWKQLVTDGRINYIARKEGMRRPERMKRAVRRCSVRHVHLRPGAQKRPMNRLRKSISKFMHIMSESSAR